MMKKLTTLFLALAVSTVAIAQTPTPNKPSPAAARPVPAAPQIGANSYILSDFNSGRILVEHNADLRVEPASITKLMTAYLVDKALEAGDIAMTDMVTISEKAWRMKGSKMFIEVNKEVSVEDLIKGMVIQSGNDATVALAEHVAGSESAFAEYMNHQAAQLGMNNTQFRNSTGWPDPDHYSTAHDIAILSQAIMPYFDMQMRPSSNLARISAKCNCLPISHAVPHPFE